MNKRYSVNWRWIGHRLRAVTCWHRWGLGDPTHAACQKCGVWRWYLIRDHRPWFKDAQPKERP